MGCLNTSLCYIEQGGRYLMLHRTKKKQDPNAGKWIGVGGKFEDGESPEECARREVEEETGLSLSSLSLRGIVTFVSDMCPTEYMFLFTADQFTGELRVCDEGELAWIEKEKVLSLPYSETVEIKVARSTERAIPAVSTQSAVRNTNSRLRRRAAISTLMMGSFRFFAKCAQNPARFGGVKALLP